MDRFTLKNANFCSYAFSQKPKIVLRKGKKNSFPIKVFEKNQILKPVFNNESDSNQVFQNGTIFWWTLHNSSFFGIRNFTARQILKHPIYHTSGFERKFQQRNRFSRETGSKTSSFLGQFAFKNFFSLYIVKMSNLRFPSFLKRLILRAIFLEKKLSLNRKLWEKSDFESIFSQRPRLFNKTKLFVSKFELSST